MVGATSTNGRLLSATIRASGNWVLFTSESASLPSSQQGMMSPWIHTSRHTGSVARAASGTKTAVLDPPLLLVNQHNVPFVAASGEHPPAAPRPDGGAAENPSLARKYMATPHYNSMQGSGFPLRQCLMRNRSRRISHWVEDIPANGISAATRAP